MTDVIKETKTRQIVTYTVGIETMRNAICQFLENEHGGIFTNATRVDFRDAQVIVTTEFTS